MSTDSLGKKMIYDDLVWRILKEIEEEETQRVFCKEMRRISRTCRTYDCIVENEAYHLFVCILRPMITDIPVLIITSHNEEQR